jgi:hypothetical protein
MAILHPDDMDPFIEKDIAEPDRKPEQDVARPGHRTR